MMLWMSLILILIIYKWLTRDHDYFEKIGIPFEKPWPIFGNMGAIIMQKESMVDLMMKSYNKYKKSQIFGFFNTVQIAFVVTDPEIVKRITIKDFDHFVNHTEAFKVDDLLSRTVVVSRDKKWRDMRTTLSPIFTSSKMKMMYELLYVQVKEFIKYMQEGVDVGRNLNVELVDTFSRYTADGISTAVLGFVGDCVKNEKSELFQLTKKMDRDFNSGWGALKFLFSFAFPKFAKIFNIQISRKETKNFFKRVVLDEMNERESKNISRPDVIQLLLQARKGQLQNKAEDINEKELSNFSAHTEIDVSLKNEKMTQFEDMDWIAQGFIFYGAGFDTVSSLIQSACYELALNPHVQNELIDEIDNIRADFNGKDISFEALHQMKYLDMLVSEVLRFWPPAPQTERSCNKDYDLKLNNGITVPIKEGQVVFLPTKLLHHDPEYFPEPEKFNPYRFSDENKHLIVSGSYIPFGSGPRTCIGSRFALMSSKLLLFNLLSNFRIEKCDKTPNKLTYQPNLAFKFNELVYLNFIPRR